MKYDKPTLAELIISGHSSFLQAGLTREVFSQIVTEPEYVMTNENYGISMVGFYNDYYGFDKNEMLMAVACKFDKYEISDTESSYSLFADYEEWKNMAIDSMVSFIQSHRGNMRILTTLPYDDDELITIGLDPPKPKHLIIAYTRQSQRLINIEAGI